MESKVEPKTAYVAVGSNIQPGGNIPRAIRQLKRRVRILAASMLYRTQAVGTSKSPDFVNGVLSIETDLPPRELKFGVLREIEAELGRVRREDKYAPRPIDLDIILYGDTVMDEPDLVIPDPDLHTRAFIAIPLLELAPGLVLPGGETLADVAGRLDTSGMTPLEDLTLIVRRETET